MRTISNFSTRYPKTVFLIVIALTVFFVQQIATKMYVESDVTKSLPTDLPVIKANDYFNKNYKYHESLIVGMEAKQTGIMDLDVLRANEKITREIQAIKTVKTIDSKLTGKKETIELPSGINTDDINGISGLEDAMMDRETGAVVTGSVVSRLKQRYGIQSTDETAGDLPTADTDLQKIIPDLEKHILSDRLFRGNLLSSDGKATSIVVPMINKWEYKQRFARQELETAMDPAVLKSRYLGEAYDFPYKVYGKTIDGITYDDAHIARHSQKTAEKLKDFLDDYLEPAYASHPDLRELMAKPMTAETFKAIYSITLDRDFFLNPKLPTWDSFVNELYDLTLAVIDPLSRESLEFQIPDVSGVYNFIDVYDQIRRITTKYENDNIKTYIAGQPVMAAVLLRTISKDMGVLLPIGLVVVFIMLGFSFRSVRGVVIPLITVILSVIWAVGFLAAIGIPMTTATSVVPVILLAVGSAYGIHFLNRYYEGVKTSNDRRQVSAQTITTVGVAILMAGLTTFAGFISLSSSSVAMIREFAIATSFGVVVALALTLTLTPAILCYWKLPKKTRAQKESPQKTGRFERALLWWAKMVKGAPKRTVAVFLIISVASGIAMVDLKFEGGMIQSFAEDNPVRASDEFINQYLSGTGEIKFLFKFRDAVNLDNAWIKKELKNRVDKLDPAWEALTRQYPNLSQSPISKVERNIVRLSSDPTRNSAELREQIGLMANILNEEYAVELETEELAVTDTSEEDMDALFAAESTEAEDDLGGFDDLMGLADMETISTESTEGQFSQLSADQINGLKDLNQRLGLDEADWEMTGKSIVLARELKSTEFGQRMMKQWNLTQDLFAADIKQPYVLHKLEAFRDELVQVRSPQIKIKGEIVNPTGAVFGPVDMVRKTYAAFYHDEDPAFKKIPDVEHDNLGDPTITDRGVIGVVLNQAQNSSRDSFESMISPDLKEFQFSVMLKSMLTTHSDEYLAEVHKILAREFPADAPYIESVSVAGQIPMMREVTNLIAQSQLTSIAQAMVFVFIVTFFIFRSAIGGIYSLLPLIFTVLTNFGMMRLLNWDINTGTVLVASISIGIGVDYTIHFLERFKAQLKSGDDFENAYFNTIQSVGKAILVNALSVAAGFLVLLISEMGATQSMGLLMVGTMAYSSAAALTLLPAIMFVRKPRFLSKIEQPEKVTAEMPN